MSEAIKGYAVLGLHFFHKLLNAPECFRLMFQKTYPGSPGSIIDEGDVVPRVSVRGHGEWYAQVGVDKVQFSLGLRVEGGSWGACLFHNRALRAVENFTGGR